MKHELAKLAASNYTTQLLEDGDPRIEEAAKKYIKRWNLSDNARPCAERWFGVFDGPDLLLCVGERRVGETLEVTDMYPTPHAGRRGTIAVYAMMNVYRQALATGLYKFMQVICLFQNKSFQRALEKMFNVTPSCVIYMAESHAA